MATSTAPLTEFGPNGPGPGADTLSSPLVLYRKLSSKLVIFVGLSCSGRGIIAVVQGFDNLVHTTLLISTDSEILSPLESTHLAIYQHLFETTVPCQLIFPG